MPFSYEPPPDSGPLRQGEILANVWEHRASHHASAPDDDRDAVVHSFLHPRVIVMTADCDLDQDFNVRFSDGRLEEPLEVFKRDYGDSALLPHLLLCDLYDESEIRSKIARGSEVWRRILQNQNERYHHLNGGVWWLPNLYLDFKKTLAIPTESTYLALGAAGTRRLAVVPPVYIHDLMHRFFGFLSRVGLPE